MSNHSTLPVKDKREHRHSDCGKLISTNLTKSFSTEIELILHLLKIRRMLRNSCNNSYSLK